MSTKQKAAKHVAPPKDERKVFVAATYKMNGNRLRLVTMIGKDDAQGGRDEPFNTVDGAIAAAHAHLSKMNQNHYPCDGVMVFESVALVKPKKIEVEIETFPVKA